jgi:hypothetical protein
VRFVLSFAALSLAACVVGPSGPRGYHDARVEGVLVISSAEAASLGPATHHERSFARGEASDDVLVAFLQSAQDAGARYVSSLAIHLVVDDADCVTYVGPKEDIEQRWKTVYHPGHTEYERHLRPVTRSHTTWERECRTVQRPHTVTRTEYTTEYDYSSHTSRSVPRTRTVTEYRSEQECHSVPRTRTETTYEYQTESKWIPPRLDHISETYSHWRLVESAPSCTPLAPGMAPMNRIEAQIHGDPSKTPTEMHEGPPGT